MAFNRKKFLDALLEITARPLPEIEQLGAPPVNFAKFMAASSYGIADATDASIVGEENRDDEEKGALSKTFGWLMSPMTAVENIVLDAADTDKSIYERLGGIGQDVTGFAAHAIQPVAEVLAIPGIDTPWEPDAIGDYAQKHNTEYHGTGDVSGSRVLERFTGNDNPWLGLGLDVALDPLTYLGGIGLPGKAKTARNLLDASVAADKGADAIKPVASGSSEAFTKPIQAIPEFMQQTPGKSKFSLPGIPAQQAPFTGAPKTGIGPSENLLPNLDELVPGSLGSVADTSSLSLQERLNLPLDPKSLQQIRGANLNDIKLYEKLRPVVFPEKNVPARPEFEGIVASANEMANYTKQGLDDFSTPRPLTREDQVRFFEYTRDDMIENGITSANFDKATETKYFIKGLEDNLEAAGFTFPEGKLSQYMHTAKDKYNLEEFAKGKPLKERPMDATMEEKLLQIQKAQGRDLLEAKLQKTNPSAVVTKHGINSRVVSEAIDRVAAGTNDVIYQIPKAEGPVVVKAAVDTAESAASKLGKPIPGTTQKRLPELNPANQANLFNRLYDSTAKLISENPELLSRFKDKKTGKMVLNSKRAIAWRKKTALSMLKTAEEHLVAKQGLRGQHWDGSGLRLSAVIEELGPDATAEHITKVLDAFKKSDASLVTDPVAKAAITNAIARRKLETGTVAKAILDDYVKTDKILEGTISAQKYLEWKNGPALQKARFAATAAGLNSEELRPVLDLLKNHTDVSKIELLEPQQIVDALGSATVKAVLEGHADHKLIKKVNTALREAVNETPKAQSLDIAAKTAGTTLMMRMTTWYNRGEMIHDYRSASNYLEIWAKARADWFHNKMKKYTVEEQTAAFRYAQGTWKNIEIARQADGITEPLVNERVMEASKYISDYMENILASSRTINDPAKLKGSVAVRANVMMQDVNKQLKALNATAFQFTDSTKIKKSTLGNPAGGGKGYGDGNWMLSWENADPTKLGQNPVDFMYDLSLALDRVTMEYNLIDDFVMRFGKSVNDVGYDRLVNTKGVHHHRVDPAMKFDSKVATDFQNLLNDIEQGAWLPSNKFMREALKVQRMWKTGVTIYNPSHHVRNMIGDAFLMWLAGHNNPIHFAHAQKILASQRHRYKDAIKSETLDELDSLMGKEASGVLGSKGTSPILRKYGTDITAEEIYYEAIQEGMLLDVRHAEDIIGDPLFSQAAGRNPSALRKFIQAPLGRKAHNTVTTVSEVREHYVRLAHFSAAIEKGLTPAIAKRLKAAGPDIQARREVLKDVYQNSSREVRKWHPDGRDMSQFEQKYMRNIIPFYSWQRKAIPLLLEAMYMQPAKLTMYPKASFALQNQLGIEAPGLSDPYPVDQLYPDWMRAGGIGPIGDPQSENAAAAWFGKLGRNAILPGIEGEFGRTVIDPGNPFNDTVEMFGGTGEPSSLLKGLGSGLTPYFNIPKEVLSDKTFTGAPISQKEGGEGYLPYIGSQVPIASMLQRILEPGEDKQNFVEPGRDNEAIINILTALGLRGSGQYLKTAQFDARD